MSTLRSSSFANSLVAVIWTFALTGCGGGMSFSEVVSPGIKGSGVEKTEERQVGDFTEIDASAAMNVDLTVGPQAKLEVAADDNLLEHLKTEIKDGKLRIFFDASTSSKIGVNVKASTPSLKAYHGSGATSAKVTGVKAEAFKLGLSGASNCTISGSADRLAAECSGASKINATKLIAKTAKVEASGASTIEVHAADELDADASGASTILFSGNPGKVKKDASGAATIKAKG